MMIFATGCLYGLFLLFDSKIHFNFDRTSLQLWVVVMVTGGTGTATIVDKCIVNDTQGNLNPVFGSIYDA